MAACCAMAQTDVWKEQGGAPQGDAILEHKMANPVYYQEAGKRALKVEPFAVYKATAKVKGNVPNGGGMALVNYGWDSFGWHFSTNVPVGVWNDWRDVSVNFCVPVERVDFTPLVLSNAKLCRAACPVVPEVTKKTACSPDTGVVSRVTSLHVVGSDVAVSPISVEVAMLST